MSCSQPTGGEPGTLPDPLRRQKEWFQELDAVIRDRASVPELPQLKRLITTLFLASLETEEGVHPQVSVLWLPRRAAEGELGKSFRWSAFASPLQVSRPDASFAPSPQFRKVAALCESRTVVLLVDAAAPGSDVMEAWGILDLRNPPTNPDSSLKDLLELSNYPEAVSIHFESPGRFEVRWHGKFLKSFPDENPQTIHDLKLFKGWSADNGWEIGGVVDRHENRILEDCWNRSEVEEFAAEFVIECALGWLVRRRTGGAFLIPGESERGGLPCDLQGGPRMPSSGGRSPREEIREYVAAEKRDCMFFNDGSIRYRLRMLAGWLANYATVDGCVVLSPELSVRAFGAKIVAGSNEWKKKTAEPTLRFLETRGTRHGSAARWVASRLPDGRGGRRALVVSQDGLASAFFWKDDAQVIHQALVYRML